MRLYIAFFLSIASWFCLDKATAQSSVASVAESLRPKKFVLSIGTGKFESPLWRELRFSRKDAEDMYRFFHESSSEKFDGGELLIDQNERVEPTTIRRSLQRLAQDNRSEDDTVVVYISSHGTVGYKQDGKIGRYIITSSTDPQRMAETALDYDELLELFQRLKSRKKVLILAFCHSGVGKSVLTPEMKRALAQLKAPYFAEPIQERSEGSIILTASAWREPAVESDKLQNDVYTHYLIEGFRQDRNNDGAVSITEAHAYATQATYKFTEGRQRPSAILELLGSDPVIVYGSLKKNTRSASLFSLMDRFSKLVVSIDGKDYGSVEKGMVVPEGDVRLTIKDPESQKVLTDRVVNFQSGREYSIANYLLPRFPQSLALGTRSMQFADRSTINGYARRPMQGVTLRYTHEEAFSLYDVVFDLGLFPEKDENIEVHTATQGVRSFNQKRSMLSATLGASRRYTWTTLSRSDRTIRTDARWLLGTTALMVKRSLSEEAFEHKDRTVYTGGVSTGLALETTWVYHLMRAGIEFRVDALRNFSGQSTRVLLAPTAAFYLGTFW